MFDEYVIPIHFRESENSLSRENGGRILGSRPSICISSLLSFFRADFRDSSSFFSFFPLEGGGVF